MAISEKWAAKNAKEVLALAEKCGLNKLEKTKDRSGEVRYWTSQNTFKIVSKRLKVLSFEIRADGYTYAI